LVTIVGSTLGCVGFIGLPISEIVQAGVIAMAILVAVSGFAMWSLSTPSATTHHVANRAAW
jgi:hypothetical protein